MKPHRNWSAGETKARRRNNAGPRLPVAFAGLSIVAALAACEAEQHRPDITPMTMTEAVHTLNNCGCRYIDNPNSDGFKLFKVQMVMDEETLLWSAANGDKGRSTLAEFRSVDMPVTVVLAGNRWFVFSNLQRRNEFIDAMSVYRQNWPALKQQQEAAFEEAAKSYHAAPPTPGEEIRRAEVQAEEYVRTKQFAEAAEIYARALEQSPWWPEGHFNRAMIMAELGAYHAAITDMKRYLILTPNAANARRAQDNIYAWEAHL